jgi:hypothetical protein
MPRRSTIVRKQLVEVTSGEADPDQQMLDEIGTRLYGNSWQSALARDLGLSRRSIERWRFGMFRIAPDRWEQILFLLHRKRGEIMELEHELANYMAHRPLLGRSE